MTTSVEGRRTLLVATAEEIGQRLFALQRDEMVREGRLLTGGWPGTIREARSLASAVLPGVLARHRMSAATDDEVGWVMHAAYGEARRAWLAAADRDHEPEV